jgi:hypothetical protein
MATIDPRVATLAAKKACSLFSLGRNGLLNLRVAHRIVPESGIC